MLEGAGKPKTPECDGQVEVGFTGMIRIEQEGAIELLAIGIGHDVTRYYSRAVTLHDVEQLGDVMLEEITRLFVKEDARMARKNERRKTA